MKYDEEIQKYHYACQVMLSNYIPINNKGDIDMNK